MKKKSGDLPSVIRAIFTSDWHLGNNRVRPRHMIDGLMTTINEPILEKTDILFLGGDIWDKGLTLPALQVPEIFTYIHSLLKLCAKTKTKVRVLEGTPSHDRKQSRFFKVINDMLETPADLKYYDELCIDYEEDLGIHVLYVPDEWKHSPDKAWEDTLKELKRHDIEKVDFAIMHGSFKYQMPEEYGIASHEEARYLNIVSRYISVGHIHKYSRNEHIIAQGSHDRTTFAETERKGLMYVESYGGDRKEDRLTFVENFKAMPFHTIDLKGCSHDDTPKVIDRKLQSLLEEFPNKDLFIKVKSAESEINRTIFNNFSKAYPDINWFYETHKAKKKPTEKRKKLTRANMVINSNTIMTQVDEILDASECKNKDATLLELESLR